jgi:hypothetical protein
MSFDAEEANVSYSFDGGGNQVGKVGRRSVPNSGVIDDTKSLSSVQLEALKERVTAVSLARQRPITLLLTELKRGQQIEDLGWAVAKPGAPGSPVLVVLDMGQGSTRVQGDVDPRQSVEIARAAGPLLRERKLFAAGESVLDSIQRLAPLRKS